MLNLHDKNHPEDIEEPDLETPDMPDSSDNFIPPEEVAKLDSTEPDIETTDAPQVLKQRHSTPFPKQNKVKAFFVGYWDKKKWTLPLTTLVLLAAILALPSTRYAALGLFMKSQVTLTVLDSKTTSPVSGATVSLAGQSFKTDATGKANGKVKLGSSSLTVTKQYYRASLQAVTVTFSKQHNSFKALLVATGRQVPLKVVNKITGKPLAGAEIKVLNTEAKTDKTGTATIVLPTTAATQKAVVALGGYNTAATTVTVTDKVVTANSFSLTPAGRLYFLSNLSGKIDVVKTNLDGTDRQTVLAGTGTEEANNTSLLASRDWKHVALLSKRTSGDSSEINVIDTGTNKVTNVDQGDASFSLVGWDNDSFIYLVSRNGYNSWQPNAVSLKSFDAQTGKLTILDNTKAIGSNNYDAKYEALFSDAVHIMGDTIVYAKSWYAWPGYLTVPGQQNSLNAVNADGSNKKVIASQDAGSSYFGTLYQYSPQSLIVQISNTDNSPATYYEYKTDGSYAKDSEAKDIAALESNVYPTYLASPSGNQTFWSDQRDGKNALFVGDKDGTNEKQIASLSEYSQYGWYSDSYLLVSKNSSELYILPVDGSTTPFKITDYYKPATNYRGYGGGYGGL